uniref:uncharacterized protein LOC132687269 n=1 Tax=Panthera onca TaxID=9690 RepID=UPI00295386FA|nr:uncharacterized protein LOC132687269 [Panthera onca]
MPLGLLHSSSPPSTPSHSRCALKPTSHVIRISQPCPACHESPPEEPACLEITPIRPNYRPWDLLHKLCPLRVALIGPLGSCQLSPNQFSKIGLGHIPRLLGEKAAARATPGPLMSDARPRNLHFKHLPGRFLELNRRWSKTKQNKKIKRKNNERTLLPGITFQITDLCPRVTSWRNPIEDGPWPGGTHSRDCLKLTLKNGVEGVTPSLLREVPGAQPPGRSTCPCP